MGEIAEIDYVKVSRLKEWHDFDFCWNGISVSLKDVDEYMRRKKKVYNLDCCDVYYLEWSKTNHLERIAYFIDYPEKITPINLDNECSRMNIFPIPIIVDGRHRFMASIYREDEIIPAYYCGLLSVLEYLTGKSDIKPEY